MSGVRVAFVAQPQCRRCPQATVGSAGGQASKEISPGGYMLAADFCNKIGP